MPGSILTSSAGAHKNANNVKCRLRPRDIWRRGAVKPAPIEPMNQIDEDIFDRDVSDEVLEAASGSRVGEMTTLMNGSYCFTCAPEGETVS
jgi:hypothetical protein